MTMYPYNPSYDSTANGILPPPMSPTRSTVARGTDGANLGPFVAPAPVRPAAQAYDRTPTVDAGFRAQAPLAPRVGMAGGASPADYAATADAQRRSMARLESSPLPPINHMNAANGMISDQVARQMFQVATNQNPGDAAAAQRQFHETMAKYGVNGKALLDQWHGTPQTQFMRTPATVQVDRIPYNMLGTDKSGGNMLPGAGIVPAPSPVTPGGSLYVPRGVQPATYGPKPGFTPLPSSVVMAPTQKLDPGEDQRLGQIRDQYQAPYTQEDLQRVRQAELDRLATSAKAHDLAAPVTEREVFDAGNQLAQKQIDAAASGRTVYHVGDGRGGVTGQTRAADRVAFFKGLSGERVDDGKGGTRRMTYREKMDSVNSFFGPDQPEPASDSAPATTYGGGNGAAPINRATAAPTTRPTTGPVAVRSGWKMLPNGQQIRVHQRADGTVVDDRGNPVK